MEETGFRFADLPLHRWHNRTGRVEETGLRHSLVWYNCLDWSHGGNRFPLYLHNANNLYYLELGSVGPFFPRNRPPTGGVGSVEETGFRDGVGSVNFTQTAHPEITPYFHKKFLTKSSLNALPSLSVKSTQPTPPLGGVGSVEETGFRDAIDPPFGGSVPWKKTLCGTQFRSYSKCSLCR